MRSLPLATPHANTHHRGNVLAPGRGKLKGCVSAYIYICTEIYIERLGAGSETVGGGGGWATQCSHPILVVAMGDRLHPSWSSYCSNCTVLSPWWHPPESERERENVRQREVKWKRERETKKGREGRKRNRRERETVTLNSPSHPQPTAPLPNSFITRDSTNCVWRSYSSLQGDVVKCCDWSLKPEGWLLETRVNKKIKRKFYDCGA